MLGYIWFGMIALATIVGATTGTLDAVVESIPQNAQRAFEVSLSLGGIMSLWLGLMRIAEDSGMVMWLARATTPITRRLFPNIPEDHPAMGAITLNIAANMLGLSNAATPFGIRAMEKLEELNPYPGIASNAMCTFLAINTSSVQLIPTTAMGLLAASGGKYSSQILVTSLLATTVSTIVAITASLFFAKKNKSNSWTFKQFQPLSFRALSSEYR